MEACHPLMHAVRTKLDAMRALKDAAEAKVVFLQAEELSLAEKPTRYLPSKRLVRYIAHPPSQNRTAWIL